MIFQGTDSREVSKKLEKEWRSPLLFVLAIPCQVAGASWGIALAAGAVAVR